MGSPEQTVEQRVIGLISGTSVDGIDAALVDISGTDYDLHVQLLSGQTFPYPPQLRERILAICGGAALSMAELAELDDAIATEFARAAIAIQAEHSPADLIGSHGQTVYHDSPQADRLGYSLQLGRGSVIAAQTGITTVSNFRAADIAAGGQGAPLVSRVDAYLLGHPTYRRCIQNLGGIGNFTYLPALGTSPLASSGWDREILGGDTGPSNVLIDLAVQQLTQGQQTYDQDGAWAATGKPCVALVAHWLKHPFFQLAPPKSTGRELFGEAYLQQCLADAEPYQLSSADLLATLTELTACSVVQHYQMFLPQMPDQVLLCGGGSRNQYLKQRLQYHFGSIPVLTTEDAGVSVDFKEAIAFAVLAYWRQRQIPGNLPVVTGAAQALPLGDIAAVIGDNG